MVVVCYLFLCIFRNSQSFTRTKLLKRVCQFIMLMKFLINENNSMGFFCLCGVGFAKVNESECQQCLLVAKCKKNLIFPVRN